MASKLTSKEFFDEIAALAQSTRAEIDAFSIGLDRSPKAIKERRKRVLSGDFKFFAYTYFPHHIRGESSEFQAHFCTRVPQILERAGGATEWWIAPRGEAKSSLATKITPLWCIVQELRQHPEIQKDLGVTKPPIFIDYIIQLGAETSLPDKLIEVVKTELTANAALELDFPEVCGRGPMWRIGEIVTRNGIKIESFGAEQAIRGTFHGASRPKLLLGDDLITDAEAKSPTERNNRWAWLTKAVDYLGGPDGTGKYIGVGTVLNKDDPISRAKRTIGHIVHHFKALVQEPKNMHLWAKCEEIMLNEDKPLLESYTKQGLDLPDNQLPSYLFYLDNKADMDDGAVTSWPSVRSLFWLMRQRAKDRKSFATEMQGDGRADEDKVFTNITYWQQRSKNWLIFGACDPSMGKGRTSNPSSILVGGYDLELGRLNVMEADSKRRVPSKLEADLISTQRYYNCLAIGFENNNAYEHSRSTFIKAALRAGINLPLIGITASIPLEVRIDSLEPLITDTLMPRIILNQSQKVLLDELDTWPEKQSDNKHYDCLATLYMLWHVALARGQGFAGFQAAAPRNSHSTEPYDPFMDDDNNVNSGYDDREIW